MAFNWNTFLQALSLYFKFRSDKKEDEPEEKPSPKPEPKPDPPVEPPKTEYKLTGYVWENSDSKKGKSYILLPTTYTGDVKAVHVGANHFVFEEVWHDGRELWYGPVITNKSTVMMKLKNGDVYKDEANAPPLVDVPDTPKPVPTHPDWNETLRYHGRYNGDRPTWYASRNMREYPKVFTVEIPGCVKMTIKNNGHRYEKNGIIVKQSDVRGRGMAVIYKSSCRGKQAALIF